MHADEPVRTVLHTDSVELTVGATIQLGHQPCNFCGGSSVPARPEAALAAPP